MGLNTATQVLRKNKVKLMDDAVPLGKTKDDLDLHLTAVLRD